MVLIPIAGSGQSNFTGTWQVNDEHSTATYEIFQHESVYYGMVHYYKDKDVEHHGKNSEADIFITDVLLEGKNANGTIYLFDGSSYPIHFRLLKDSLKVTIDLKGATHTEIWKRPKQ